MNKRVTKSRPMFILAHGNVFVGLEVHGPFATEDAAEDYARAHHFVGSWYVKELLNLDGAHSAFALKAAAGKAVQP
jgi:hypothetical protein